MSSIELMTCIVLIFISAYMSASEIALFSLSRFQLKSLKEGFRATHRKIKRLLSDPSGLLISLLVVNEIINIALSSIITEAVSRLSIPVPIFLSNIPRWAFDTLLGIIITAPIVLIFCEATPKVAGAKLNRIIALLTIGPLTIVYDILKPIRFCITSFFRFIERQRRYFRGKSDQLDPGIPDQTKILRESDFLLMVEEGHKEGAIEQTEVDLIKNVFELDNTTVADVATPLSQVLSLPVNTTLKGALIAVRSQRYSRIPILATNRKDVVGILYSKDLLRSKLQPEQALFTVTTLMRKPYFVRENLKLNSLFRKFKQQKIHMAIVKNNHGDITGVVTMSDLLEALFEDFFTEDQTFQLSHGTPNYTKRGSL